MVYIIPTLCLTTSLQEPRGSSPTAQPMSYRVVGTEVLVATQTSHLVETAHKIRRQGQEFLHRLGLFPVPVFQKEDTQHDEYQQGKRHVGDGLRRVHRLWEEGEFHLMLAWFHTQRTEDIIDTP